MTTWYREPAQEATSSSSSSGEESQVVPHHVLTSSSSQYFVQSVLGKGVFGKVVKCVKTTTRETVAVKILRSNKVTAEAQNEVDVLQRLRAFDSDRFNFVRFNDSFIDREHVCFEFEMLDMSLWDFMQERASRSLSVKEIRPIVHQMATALQLLKNMGIIHTDIKPDNIMLVDHINQPMKIKLIDFSLACHVSESKWGKSASPLAYRAPENILGFPITPALDMWSLGCVAAELFTGNLLYRGHSEYAMELDEIINTTLKSLRYMVQTRGPLPQQLLRDGINTTYFFQRKPRHHRWRLKTSEEYGHTSWTKTCLDSLDDLTKVKPVCHLSDKDTKAEIEDRENFVDLLKKMLHLDVDQRITPNHLLEDPFITMNDLADRYPNSFYVKSCCEMMEVCQDQGQSADTWDQASTSSSSVRQDLPAWHSRQEHPLILELASAFSYLAISTDQDPSEPEGKDEERTRPELQLPVTCDEAQSRDGLKPASKRPRDTSSWSDDSSKPDRKRKKVDVATCSAAKEKPEKKRRRDAFIEQQKKTKRRRLFGYSRMAPSDGPTDAPEMKLPRKRTWDSAHAHSGGSSRGPGITSPKRMKMNQDGVQTLKGD